ncbi:MAG TPA: nitrilase-related carbon-nitrogen hydrolase [Bacteroidota bacterium]|nr:nitrilase-related carbon-nitrogen hydrolase [Bacteroidota bacterium]
MTLTIATAQIAPPLGKLEASIEQHVAWIDRARAAGAGLVVFPELSLSGYTVRDLNHALALRCDDARLNVFRERSRDITIILGGVEEDERYGVYNSAFVFDEGRCDTYRKMYPPDYGIFEEGRYFLRGNSARLIATRHGRIGVLVCEDLWHVSLPMLQALDGAELICAISASPTRLSPVGELPIEEVNSEHHRSLCRLLTVNMAFVNRVGYEDGVNFWGGSEIVDAFGTVLSRCGVADEELGIATVGSRSVRDARRASRHFLDEDIPFIQRELARVYSSQGGC